jgi:hypothetical protein
VDRTRENPRHPANDPAFQNRRRPDPQNPANDPTFLYELLDRMEQDEAVRDAVWDAFESGDLSFLLHDTQVEIKAIVDREGVDEFLIFCSRQLGKSFLILVIAIEHCARLHGRRAPLVRIFCETVKQAEDIVNDNMMPILALAPPGWIKRTRSDNRWKVGLGEIRLCPLAAAHVDGKRGGNATLVLLEEGCVSKSDSYRQAIGSVINPQLLRSGGKLGHITTPPKDISHYVVTDVLPKTRAAGAYAHKTVYDNVQLSDEQIFAAFERCTDLEEWEREYLCMVVKSMTRTVIPDFIAVRHVRDMKLPRFAYWQTALDFGGVMDKHGVILTFYDFERAKLCVWDERLLEINTSTPEIKASGLAMEAAAAAVLKEKGSALWLGTGPRRVSDCPGQIVVDLRAMKYSVRTPDKEPGSWEAGINVLRRAFQEDQVEIHPRCTWLIATLDYGLYTENRKDFQRTEALGHLDLLSALIYAWRHKNTANPFPRHLDKHPQAHHVPRGELVEPAPLEDAFLPSYLR